MVMTDSLNLPIPGGADTGPSLPPGLEALLDRVGDRQRADFGHMASTQKADGSLITACDLSLIHISEPTRPY